MPGSARNRIGDLLHKRNRHLSGRSLAIACLALLCLQMAAADARAEAGPPAAVVERINVGPVSYQAAPRLRLPERTTSLQIDYGAAPAGAGEVRFRYRLDGVDGDWQEAGARHMAYYTNLGPGPYRFHVAAAYSGEAWSQNEAVLDFIIEPTYYQTGWFRFLICVAVFVLLWLMYLLRLRQMTLRLRLRLEERYLERERIARELHDTFLQSVQGLILRFHALAGQIEQAPTRQAMEQTLDHADRVMEEGRDRVRALRNLSQPMLDLAQGFESLGRELAEMRQGAYRVQQQRSIRSVDPIIGDEVYQVGREAVINACQHAHAGRIEVEIVYGRHELVLRVRDDGVGIDAAVLKAGGVPGHWGLAGMRERAQRIKAYFEIRSGVGLGTEVELRVPAAIAYCGTVTKSWWLRVLGRAVAEDVIP